MADAAASLDPPERERGGEGGGGWCTFLGALNHTLRMNVQSTEYFILALFTGDEAFHYKSM